MFSGCKQSRQELTYPRENRAKSTVTFALPGYDAPYMRWVDASYASAAISSIQIIHTASAQWTLGKYIAIRYYTVQRP